MVAGWRWRSLVIRRSLCRGGAAVAWRCRDVLALWRLGIALWMLDRGLRRSGLGI